MDGINSKFMKEIARIKSPEIFLGIAKLLGVRLVENQVSGADCAGGTDLKNVRTRDFTDIFEDVMEAFSKKNKTLKKELLSILKKANKASSAYAAQEPQNQGVEENANSTQTGEADISNKEM